MSEEEKKAIESLKWYFEDSKSLDIAKQTDIVLNLIEKQQKEIENLLKAYKQDEKIIQEMAEYIEDTVEDDICNKENCFADKYENGHCQKCVNCIIDYFRKGCNND